MGKKTTTVYRSITRLQITSLSMLKSLEMPNIDQNCPWWTKWPPKKKRRYENCTVNNPNRNCLLREQFTTVLQETTTPSVPLSL